MSRMNSFPSYLQKLSACVAGCHRRVPGAKSIEMPSCDYAANAYTHEKLLIVDVASGMFRQPAFSA